MVSYSTDNYNSSGEFVGRVRLSLPSNMRSFTLASIQLNYLGFMPKMELVEYIKAIYLYNFLLCPPISSVIAPVDRINYVRGFLEVFRDDFPATIAHGYSEVRYGKYLYLNKAGLRFGLGIRTTKPDSFNLDSIPADKKELALRMVRARAKYVDDTYELDLNKLEDIKIAST